MNRSSKRVRFLALAFILAASATFGQTDTNPEGLNIINFVDGATSPGGVSSTLFIFFLITVLTLAPAILVMTTSFTRIIVVLGFLRQAMATQQSPPAQVLVSLALILTVFIMAPVYRRINSEALQPYINQEIGQEEALQKAIAPVRDFMFNQVRDKDLVTFLEIAKLPPPDTPDDVPTHVLIPAFIISELRIAFWMGFFLYIPFLIIDMVVASTLMSMGMMMLPPVFVSLPFKIAMFVLADGWNRVVMSLVMSFN